MLEFWITPFDYAPYDGPERAAVSRLEENGLIALSWSVLDFDESTEEYEGFWNLSHETSMYEDASKLCAFRLMPLEPEYLEPLEAEYSFKVIDMDRRLIAFTDRSRGEITSWSWDFGDSTSSAEQHPIHQYEEPGEFVVILDVEGPEGKARRIKVNQVVVK